MGLLEWLHRHPAGWIAVGILAIAAFVAWFNAPITWRDGEGDGVEGGDESASWLHFLWYRLLAPGPWWHPDWWRFWS